LSALQREALRALAGMAPAWALTGGGALCGFHLGHRETRDLDLFFHGLRELGDTPREVERRLEAAGFEVTGLRTSPSYRQYEARKAGEVVVVDLVAEPVPTIEPPVELEPGVSVDTPHEILVNKLAALYSRNAVRDLYDVQCLLVAGGDLERALRDAPRKDGGVSGPGLAWLLEQWDVRKAAAQSGFDPEALDAFRRELIERVLR
jgi:predicted RNA binding protein YcfA (HicA-like mRNA interferase family)